MKDLELLRAACCVAGLDGEVGEDERAAIEILQERAGVGAASLAAMLDIARTDSEFYEEQFELLLSDPEHAIKTLWKVAAIDGRVSTDEAVILRYFGHKLGLDDARVEEIIDETKRSLGARSGGSRGSDRRD